MRNIKLMSENLANKIAAGEIVTRPVSVIKELVENSIDAESDQITINLSESGIRQIKVSDNGLGMDYDNLSLCTKRHATSKIYDEAELFKISSLGFRGEALASIYAVSKLSIISSMDASSVYKLSKIDDNNFEIEKYHGNRGTSIIVDSLFYNTPARFSGLSNPNYELSLIVKYIQSVSLIHPQIMFKLFNDEHLIYESHGRNDIVACFNQIYNTSVSKSIIKVNDHTNNFNVEMYFSNASVSKARKNHIIIAINNRLVRSREIEKAVIESYKNYLHTNQYPICVIKVDVSYSLLDVNIHPTKQEIKISLIEELIDTISFNIKSSLRGKEYINTFKSEITYDDFIDKPKKIDENQATFSFDTDIKFKNDDILSESLKVNDQEILESDEKYDLNLINYIGNYQDTYLIYQNPSGLFLIDQHAAQERINYEIISKKFINHKFHMQQLLVDNVINLTHDEMMNVEKDLDKFESLGIELELFSANSLKINAVDSFYFKASNLKNDIYNIILTVSEENYSYEKHFDELAIMMSCKSSIKAHQHLVQAEADKLVSQLKLCEDKYTCPHGRPIIVSFSNYEIEKLFKRVF